MNGYEKDIENKNIVGLDIQQWKMHTLLGDAKKMMVDFSTVVSIQDKFKHIFAKVEECIDVLTKVYERVQDMENSIHASQYIANISKASEPDLHEVNDLRAKFKRNVLLEQVNRIKAAVNQIYFPFGN